MFIAVAVLSLSQAGMCAAGERPAFDPAIEQAAIAILQTKLPELRGSVALDATPGDARPQRTGLFKTRAVKANARADSDAKPRLKGRIVWF